MTYNYILNEVKLRRMKADLGIMTNRSYFDFMRERLARYLAEFSTIQSLKFSGRRVSSGRQLTLELADDSELAAIIKVLDGFGE